MGSTKVTVTVLGSGGSGGTPLIGGYWGNCDPQEPKNSRTRAALSIRTARTSVVVDTGPDFRTQILRENIDTINAIIYSHAHADHINGIDDVRYASIKHRIEGEDDYTMPFFATQQTLEIIQSAFPYMFKTSPDGLYFPLMRENLFAEGDEIVIDDVNIKTWSQIHGRGTSVGFQIGDIAYSTDVSAFEPSELEKIKGVKIWIVDCGQYGQLTEELTVHPNLERVLEWNEIVQAEKLYLTHLTPRQDYHSINTETPDYIECAYDGLTLQTVIDSDA